MHEQVKNLERLETHQEKAAKQALKEKQLLEDIGYQYEREGYLKRQPRLDLKKDVGNYNYE
jgi:hypothetical protein